MGAKIKDKINNLTKQKIKERGWTDAMIRDLLGEPDEIRKRFGGGILCIYKLERVVTAENNSSFLNRQAAAEKRKAIGCSIAQRRANDLLEKAKLYNPVVEYVYDILDLAIEDYNDKNWNSSASHESDKKFLLRIQFNFVRHNLTDYDETWEQYKGNPGVQEAYYTACEKLATAVKDEYPHLEPAINNWLSKKNNEND